MRIQSLLVMMQIGFTQTRGKIVHQILQMCFVHTNAVHNIFFQRVHIYSLPVEGI